MPRFKRWMEPCRLWPRRAMQTGTNSSKRPEVLFLGIGNPAPQYSATRHNVGQWALSKIGMEAWAGHGFSAFARSKPFESIWTSLPCSQSLQNVVLARTVGTFMNMSGPVVAKAWKKFQQAKSNSCLVVVHDELQVPLGKVQVRRRNTSARGHNGLRSIDQYMGQDYTKIAIGIGKPASGEVADYVLSRFSRSELNILETAMLPQLQKVMEDMAAGKHVFERHERA